LAVRPGVAVALDRVERNEAPVKVTGAFCVGAALGLDSEAAPKVGADEGRRVSRNEWREEETWYLEGQRVELVRRARTAFEDWLTEVRPWNVRQTLTFSGSLSGHEWLPSELAAARRVERYFRGLPSLLRQPVDGFAAIEYGTKYGRIHLEVVLHVPRPYAGCQVDASTSWERRDGNGHARTRTIRGVAAAVRYCVKYATKQRGVWILSLDGCPGASGHLGCGDPLGTTSTPWRPTVTTVATQGRLGS